MFHFHKIKKRYIFSILYFIAVVWILRGVWDEKNLVWYESSPLYKNLRECPAYVKHGFDLDELNVIQRDVTTRRFVEARARRRSRTETENENQESSETELSATIRRRDSAEPRFPARDRQTSPEQNIQDSLIFTAGNWTQFPTSVRRIINSMLDLPQRRVFSPFGHEAQEFTILIMIDINNETLEFLRTTQPAVIPGMYFAGIGENWEIFFNGRKILSQMHLDEEGRISSNRTWRDVHFPLDSSLFVQGVNILAFRIVGDPAYSATGLFYRTAPIYMDDYNVILQRQQHSLIKILCGIFGFISLYFFTLFFTNIRKDELYNLYFGIFSFMLCIFCFTRYGWVNSVIPNANIAIRLEYISLMIAIAAFSLFIETLGRGRVTVICKCYTALCLLFSLAVIFSCLQFCEEVMDIWNIITFLFFCYVFFYIVVYCHVWKWFFKRGKNTDVSDTPNISIGNILIGTTVMFGCGVLDIIDVLFIGRGLHIFHYSIFTAQIGMAITLIERFKGMYKQLDKSNIELEAIVHKRTLELETQAELAVQATKAKSEFLANMSHEIRTPMNSIIGFSELALSENIAPKTKEYLEKIKENTAGLLHIIDNILDISKVESGKMELEKVPFDLNELLLYCKAIISPLAQKKELALDFSVDASVNKKLLGDPVRLRQVIINLLSNAVKFTESGGISVSVTAKDFIAGNIPSSPAADFHVHFEIKDSGIGMTAEQTARVFEPFSQADSGITRKYGGTGLGLSIAKNLIELMGGSLMLESTPGLGSTFSFDLCFETADTSSFFEEFNAALHELEKPVFNAEVLVCEDNLSNQQVIYDHLALVGISAKMAGNGEEAVEMVKSKPFDLIFMDIHMPVMDGIEAALKISAMNAEIPIVAMTANVMSHTKDLYIMNGMADCISKPFTSRQLWQILMKYLKPVNIKKISKPVQDEADKFLIKRFEKNFLNDNKNIYDEITKTLKDGDIKKAHRLAHTLKSSAALIGKNGLMNAASETEMLLKDGINNLTQENLDNLKTELDEVFNDLILSEQAEQAKTSSQDIKEKKDALDLLKQLETMLVNRNPECMNLINEIREIPGTEELVSQLENFDLNLAIETTGNLIKKLEN